MTCILQNLVVFQLLLGVSATENLQQKTVLKFNQSIVNANAQLKKAGFAYGKSISPLFSGKPVNVKLVAQSYVNAITTLENVERQMKNLNVPQSKKARAFYQSHQKFLQGQRKMILNDFAEILSIAVNPNYNLRTRKTKIVPILDRVTKKEKGPLSELSKAQVEFVNFYNIKLEY